MTKTELRNEVAYLAQDYDQQRGATLQALERVGIYSCSVDYLRGLQYMTPDELGEMIQAVQESITVTNAFLGELMAFYDIAKELTDAIAELNNCNH